jgi:carbamoyl-phosphate synthase large subunit
MALNPESFDYYIIEVNPRVSRSSALASKATGYPIARVAAKIAVGRTLGEITNAVTGSTVAAFEPALDYCVVKIPRWPFDKFGTGDRTLFTQMKATGEVMAIDRSFEAAFMKAIRGLEVKSKDLRHPKFAAQNNEELRASIKQPTDERLWAIAEGLRRGFSVEAVNELCRVDRWFLRKIERLIAIEQSLLTIHEVADQPVEMSRRIEAAFLIGFPSPAIKSLIGITPELEQDMKRLKEASREVFKGMDVEAIIDGDQLNEEKLAEVISEVHDSSAVDWFWNKYSSEDPTFLARFYSVGEVNRLKVQPVFKMVDTCAGEFESRTPYYYGTFEQEDDAVSPPLSPSI